MARTTSSTTEPDHFSDDDLKAYQSQLASLARVAADFPLEFSLGDCAFLFESRDDIEIILDNLSQEISVSRKAA